MPCGEELVDGLPRIGGLQERTLLVARDALEDHVLAGRQPHDEAQIPQQLVIHLPGHDAAAGRDHRAVEYAQRTQGARFLFAEPRLAMAVENLRDLHPHPLDDHRIGVDELEPEAMRDQPPDGRLATAHETDENDVGVRGAHAGKLGTGRGKEKGKVPGTAQTLAISGEACFHPAACVKLAIGDIHGCARSFETLLELVQPAPTDTIILLGDFIDRGPDSCRVMDMILDLNQRCTVVALSGNHEIMLRQAATDRDMKIEWWRHGGQETMRSYVRAGYAAEIAAIPERHWQSPSSSRPSRLLGIGGSASSIHAALDPKLDFQRNNPTTPAFLAAVQRSDGPQVRKADHLRAHLPKKSGTPAVFDRGICIDVPSRIGGGWLSCLDGATQTVLQANELGRRRILPSLDQRPKGRR